MSSKESSGVDNVSPNGLDSNNGDRYLAFPNNHLRRCSRDSQIYASNHQILLKNLNSEKVPENAPRSNFPWTNVVKEPNFLGQYNREASVLEMLRGSSFHPRFQAVQGDNYGKSTTESGVYGLYLSAMQKGGGLSRKVLFRKTLTPSDVGRLNRIVVPKRYATECFPEISKRMEEEANIHDVHPEVQVDFYDRWMMCWKFRYCYWRSSQSYVFTRGWSKFVKERDLKTNVVAFYLCEIRMGGRAVSKFFMIDPVGGEDSSGSSSMSSVIEVDDHNNNVGLTSQLEMGGSTTVEGSSSSHHHHDVELRNPELYSDDAEIKRLGKQIVMDSDPPRNVEMKAVRLFGVQLN